jgi:hypothetical protein
MLLPIDLHIPIFIKLVFFRWISNQYYKQQKSPHNQSNNITIKTKEQQTTANTTAVSSVTHSAENQPTTKPKPKTRISLEQNHLSSKADKF